jgi:2-polyprenyl-6-hydroxyphenyl methylase/3-demethylubiquinone-9 3-methyltransferase
MDRLWTAEKHWYARASENSQRRAQTLYISALRIAHAALGRNFDRHVSEYQERGAEFTHDVHDWMGGYPYEVISPGEVSAEMKRLGFELIRSFTRAPGFGLFGSGCDEYVYRKKT